MTGSYVFYFASDDYGDLYMSPSTNASALAYVCGSNGYRANYWLSPEQISAPRLLEAGKRYYVRARMQESYGGDFFKVAMRILNTSSLKTSEEITYHSVRERQLVSFRTAVVREVQWLHLSGVSAGSFRILGDKCVTDSFSVLDANANIASSLASCMSCTSISVTRLANLTAHTFDYNVSFNCPTSSNFALLKVLNTDLVANGTLFFNATRIITASAPISGSVNFAINNTWGAFFPFSSSLSTFQSKIQMIPGIGLIAIQSGYNFLDAADLTIEFIDFKVCWFRCTINEMFAHVLHYRVIFRRFK